MFGAEKAKKGGMFYNNCINIIYVQCIHGDTENKSASLMRDYNT